MVSTSQIPSTMSIPHNCIGLGRSNRTNEDRGRFRGRGCANPWRSKIRFTVRSDGGSTPTGQVGGSRRNNSIRIRFAPHRGCRRRTSATAASTPASTRCGHNNGRCDRSANPATDPSRYRPTQRCNVDRATSYRTATSTTLSPDSTAPTASNRCSTTDNTTSAIPAPRSATTPHRSVNQSGSPNQATLSHITWRRTVAHHPAQDSTLPNPALSDQGRLRRHAWLP